MTFKVLNVDAYKEKALRHVADSASEKAKAEVVFETSIVIARDAGCTLREIEKVAGISNPAVLAVERRARARMARGKAMVQ